MSEFSIGEFSRDRVSHVSEVVWVTLQVNDPQGNGSHQVVEQVVEQVKVTRWLSSEDV